MNTQSKTEKETKVSKIKQFILGTFFDRNTFCNDRFYGCWERCNSSKE